MTILLAGATALGLLALWWASPGLVANLPGRVRHYVPAAVIERITTPLPTALPAPVATPVIALALATPTAADLPSPTPARQQAATLVRPTTPTAQDQVTVITPAVSQTPMPAVVSGTAPSSLPPYARIDGLPIIPQKFNNCGPTNLTIVLNHYGIEVDQFDVAAIARPNYEDRNVSPDELVTYVNENTPLAAAAYAGGDIDLLRRLIAAGFPVIIEKGLEPDAATGWMGHYLTVFGYDDITGHLLARDTYLGPWRGDGLAAYRDTERYWAQFNNTFIVLYPEERAADMRELLGPDFAGEAAMWNAAAARARAILAHSPDDPFVWFNLGSNLAALARLGDTAQFAGAAAAFDQARLLGLPPRMLWYQFGPYEAYLAGGRYDDVVELANVTLESQGGRNVEETWFYLGRALAGLGETSAATSAFERAARLNPDSSVGQAARAALGEG